MVSAHSYPNEMWLNSGNEKANFFDLLRVLRLKVLPSLGDLWRNVNVTQFVVALNYWLDLVFIEIKFLQDYHILKINTSALN